MTEWVEAVALVKANNQDVIEFLYSEIFTHFGVPKEVVTDGDHSSCRINLKLCYRSIMFSIG